MSAHRKIFGSTPLKFDLSGNTFALHAYSDARFGDGLHGDGPSEKYGELLVVAYPTSAILVGIAAALAASTLLGAILSRAGFPVPDAARRIGNVDGLRGYLAMSVLAHHFVIWMQCSRLGGIWRGPNINFFNQLGSGAVGLFFMTTGLVFYPRIIKGFLNVSWMSVYIGRLFRLLPLLIFSVAAITSVAFCRTGRGIDSGYLRPALTWITTIGEPPILGYSDSGRTNAFVLWSLRYEWQFYIVLLPLCAAAMTLVKRGFPSWVLPAAILLAVLTARVAQRPLHANLPLLTFAPLFAVGMLAYEVQARQGLARALRSRWSAVVAVAALITGMVLAPNPYSVGLPFFAVFFVTVACGNSLGGLLNTRGALVLGECSYGIYLLHGIILSVVFTELAPSFSDISTGRLPALLPFIAAAVALIASVTFLVIERPMILLGSRTARAFSRRRRSDGSDKPDLRTAQLGTERRECA